MNKPIRAGDNAIALEVEEGNRSAIRLYEKMGFNKLHLAKNFYSNSRNAFKMLKSLK